jgi:hypothetical protein
MILWNLKIETFLSCQDNNGWIWIEFASSFDGERFLSHIASHLEQQADDAAEPLYQRMTQPGRPGSWQYDVYAIDAKHMDQEPRQLPSGSIADFMIGFSIRFPRSDYSQVLKAAQRAQQKASIVAAGHQPASSASARSASFLGKEKTKDLCQIKLSSPRIFFNR